jgi:DNA helicase-2/ATP-dependent DNA helicase PcrA
VLYRTNAQSRAMEEALRRRGIAYRVVGGTRFYERREVRDALAYLRLVANPAADEAFLRIVNVPRRGIGDASVARLAEHASRSGVSLLAAAERAGEVDGIRGAAAKALPELAALIRKHAALADRGMPIPELMRELVKESGLVQALKDEGPDGEDRIANLEELIAGAADLQRRLDEEDPELMMELEEMGETAPRGVDLFLGHVALVADIDQHDPTADAVSLMTLHNAKGLEFPLRLHRGAGRRALPHEPRLRRAGAAGGGAPPFYVGITRAERKLYLCHARRRRRGAQWMDAVPSSFLESVPDELTETRRTSRIMERTSSYAQPWKFVSPDFRTRRDRLHGAAPLAAPQDDGGYQVDYSDSQDAPQIIKGARVRHPQFGGGTVTELGGAGNDVRATIDFDGVGRKTVVLRYANLEREWE